MSNVIFLQTSAIFTDNRRWTEGVCHQNKYCVPRKMNAYNRSLSSWELRLPSFQSNPQKHFYIRYGSRKITNDWFVQIISKCKELRSKTTERFCGRAQVHLDALLAPLTSLVRIMLLVAIFNQPTFLIINSIVTSCQ